MSEGNVVFLDFERAKRKVTEQETEQPNIKIATADLERLYAGLMRLKAEYEILLASLRRRQMDYSP